MRYLVSSGNRVKDFRNTPGYFWTPLYILEQLHVHNQELKSGIQADAQGLILRSRDEAMLSNILSKHNCVAMTRAEKIFYCIFQCPEGLIMLERKKMEDHIHFLHLSKVVYKLSYFLIFPLRNCIIHPKGNAQSLKNKITLVHT